MLSLKSQFKEAILNIWRKDTMIEELSNENRRLGVRLVILEKKLDLALQGLKNISEYSDKFQIAKKTLDEIDSVE